MKKVSRILGSGLISVVAAFYLFIIFGSLLEGEELSLDFEVLGITVLSILTVVSAVWVWVNARIGVWVSLVVGVLFSIFGLVTSGQNKWMAVLAAGGPIIIGSILILIGLKPEEE
jgi:hypothetical protein